MTIRIPDSRWTIVIDREVPYRIEETAPRPRIDEDARIREILGITEEDERRSRFMVKR